MSTAIQRAPQSSKLVRIDGRLPTARSRIEIATAPSEVAGRVVKGVDTLKGSRPFRVSVDPADDGAEDMFRMGDRVRQWFYQRIGMLDLVGVGSCHRNRLASDYLHEHAIAVHYNDPDVVLMGNNRRVRPRRPHTPTG